MANSHALRNASFAGLNSYPFGSLVTLTNRYSGISFSTIQNCFQNFMCVLELVSDSHRCKIILIMTKSSFLLKKPSAVSRSVSPRDALSPHGRADKMDSAHCAHALHRGVAVHGLHLPTLRTFCAAAPVLFIAVLQWRSQSRCSGCKLLQHGARGPYPLPSSSFLDAS